MILSAASQTRCESDEGSIAERFGDTVVRTAKPSPTTSPTSVVVSINAIATRGASVSAAAEADYAPRHSENQLLAGITATSCSACYPLTAGTQMDSARSDFTSQRYIATAAVRGSEVLDLERQGRGCGTRAAQQSVSAGC